VLIEGMKHICQEIGIEVTEPALRIIAANADGSVRDGLSILDQCISGGDRTVDAPQVLDFLGASSSAPDMAVAEASVETAADDAAPGPCPDCPPHHQQPAP